MNDTNVIETLLAEAPEECAHKIIDRFKAARAEGLDTDDAFEKAAFLHNHLDHKDGIDNVNWETMPLHTDELAEQDIVKLVEIMGNDVVEDVIALYRKFRSWGGNIFYSWSQALDVFMGQSRESLPKITKEEVYEKFAETKDNKLRDLLIDTFNKFLEIGMPIEKAALEAITVGKIAISVRNELGNLTGSPVELDYDIGDPNADQD